MIKKRLNVKMVAIELVRNGSWHSIKIDIESSLSPLWWVVLPSVFQNLLEVSLFVVVNKHIFFIRTKKHIRPPPTPTSMISEGVFSLIFIHITKARAGNRPLSWLWKTPRHSITSHFTPIFPFRALPQCLAHWLYRGRGRGIRHVDPFSSESWARTLSFFVGGEETKREIWFVWLFDIT